MRTIKFRGKRTKQEDPSERWIYGTLAAWRDIYDRERTCIVSKSGYHNDVDPDTVGQFTGLLDKNGREIYEGDILSVRRYDNEFMSESEEFRDAFNIDELKGNEIETITDCVFYEEASFYVGNLYLASLFGNQKHSNPIHEFEVIGNIHDHPELLNEK